MVRVGGGWVNPVSERQRVSWCQRRVLVGRNMYMTLMVTGGARGWTRAQETGVRGC